MSFERTLTPLEVVQENLTPLNVDEFNVVASIVLNIEPNSSPNEIETPVPCELEVEGRKRKLTYDRCKIESHLQLLW